MRLPIGLVYDPASHVVLDPDTGVRDALTHLFDVFTATGSARAVVKAFAAQGLTFPARHLTGPRAGGLYWKPLGHDHVLDTLHNPRYAGAYCYGRKRHFTAPNGKVRTIVKPRQEWTVLLPEAHPGYITFAQFETNQATLAANAAAHGDDRKTGPAREGPALLQGLVVCGKCGKPMTVRYHKRANGTLVPDYACQREGITTGTPVCQNICGAGVDTAVAELILDRLTPLAMEVALTVTDEITASAEHADHIRATHVQRAQRTADLARRRYLAVDPANRLVADHLEADYNTALRELASATEDYDTAKTRAQHPPDDAHRDRIRALAADFPALWNNPATPMRERKRLIRLLVTDVTLVKTGQHITVSVRLSGGQHHTMTLPRPLTAWELHTTTEDTMKLADQLLDEHPYHTAAALLNDRGRRTGWDKPFTATRLRALCHARSIPSHHQRLRDKGWLTIDEAAEKFSVAIQTIKRWNSKGLLTSRRTDGRGTLLIDPPKPAPPKPAPTRRNCRCPTQQ